MCHQEWERTARKTLKQPVGGGGASLAHKAVTRAFLTEAYFHVGQGGGGGDGGGDDDGEEALCDYLFSRHRVNVGLITATNNKQEGGREGYQTKGIQPVRRTWLSCRRWT